MSGADPGISSDGGRDVIEIELNPRERRAYDVLRTKVAGNSLDKRSGLRDMLLLLPDLLVLLFRLARDSRVPLGAKSIAVLAIAYVLSPVDLIPDFFGPLALVDDLLVVATALSRIFVMVHPDLVRSHWSGKGDALEAVRRVVAWGESAFKLRFAAILKRFGRR